MVTAAARTNGIGIELSDGFDLDGMQYSQDAYSTTRAFKTLKWKPVEKAKLRQLLGHDVSSDTINLLANNALRKGHSLESDCTVYRGTGSAIKISLNGKYYAKYKGRIYENLRAPTNAKKAN